MDGRDLLAIADESLPGEARWLSTEHAASARFVTLRRRHVDRHASCKEWRDEGQHERKRKCRHERMLEHGLQIR